MLALALTPIFFYFYDVWHGLEFSQQVQMGSAGFTTVQDGYILGRNIVDPFCIPIQGLKFEFSNQSTR